jgi:DNA-binding CsgD family transcriptional regulator
MRDWEFVRALCAATDVEAAAALFKARIGEYGVEVFASGEVDLDCLERSTFFVVHWPEAWRKFYVAGMIDHDPIMAQLQHRTTPFTWAEMMLQIEPDAAASRMIRLAREAGWEDGLVVPTPRGARRCGLVSLVRGKGEFTEAEKADLVLFSVLFHSRVRGLGAAVSFAAEPTAIGRRIGEVLLQAAKGKTDREIADILHLSRETVSEYLQSARTKLHAKNKVEAVALAVSLGVVLF